MRAGSHFMWTDVVPTGDNCYLVCDLYSVADDDRSGRIEAAASVNEDVITKSEVEAFLDVQAATYEAAFTDGCSEKPEQRDPQSAGGQIVEEKKGNEMKETLGDEKKLSTD